MTHDGSKVQCYKEQYCLGTWNVRSMGQTGDVKTEHQHFRSQQTKMDGMGEFNSDDHYIYCCGQESLRRNRVALKVNKRVQNAVCVCVC